MHIDDENDSIISKAIDNVMASVEDAKICLIKINPNEELCKFDLIYIIFFLHSYKQKR